MAAIWSAPRRRRSLILLGVTLITFALSFLIPADPVRMIAGRQRLGRRRSKRSASSSGSTGRSRSSTATISCDSLQGDLGRSYRRRRREVAELIWSRLPATLLLMVGAIFFELLIGLPAGIFAAHRRGRAVDRGGHDASRFVGVSAPQFVVGLLLLYVFAYLLGLVPDRRLRHARASRAAGAHARHRRRRLVFAHDALGMVDVLRQDYIRTARAKGVAERSVMLVHALRNAILPIIAMIGLDVGIFMSGAVVVESVFGWPGIGQLAWQAIQRLDIPIIMGVTLVAAVGIVLGNLLADLIVAVD